MDIEKIDEQKNIFERAYQKKTLALETFLNEYADYSDLRKVIEDFSSTLSLHGLCNLVVNNVSRLIEKGELILLYLIDVDENSLSLMASKIRTDNMVRTKVKKGDVFDQWVIKNRQQLIVFDIDKDVRFDAHLNMVRDELKSVIVTPLIYESRVVGTLRVNAEAANGFTADDLRLLSVVGNVASAALSNAFLYQKTCELAIRDSLTGVFVHRHFKLRLKEEYKRALLSNTPLTLIMCDLDNFKSYNDRYGHAAGDLILKCVSDAIVKTVNEAGFVARYGGEEFAVLLPSTPKDGGKEMAEKIRRAVEESCIEIRGVMLNVTLSLGVANIPVDTLDSEELIRLADACLYVAKGAGKNRVVSN